MLLSDWGKLEFTSSPLNLPGTENQRCKVGTDNTQDNVALLSRWLMPMPDSVTWDN
jgi:hypothetical protein